MRKLTLFTFIFFFLIAISVPTFNPKRAQAISGSDFNAGRIIDDHIFYDSNSLGISDIQAFLNSKMPACDTNGVILKYDSAYGDTVSRAVYSSRRGVSTPFVCLKDYSISVPARNADQYCPGAVTAGVKTAAQVIKDVSVACGVSPKAMLVLLQKEQSLITDDWPWPVQYEKATGYACPDTAPCNPEYAGINNQIYYAARQFKRYAMQPEVFGYRANRSNYIQYNPNANCGGSNVFIQNNATAGLYNYTPYQPNASALENLYGSGDGCGAYGNRNFWRMFNDWFGAPVGSYCFYGSPGASSTDISFRKISPVIEQANLTIYNGTSTNCVESHTWRVGLQSWEINTATNHQVISNGSAITYFADLDGDGIDDPILAGLMGTGSGKIEFHLWNKAMNSWKDHIISPIPNINMSTGKVVFADVDGNGIDEAILVLLTGTGSGKIEFHVLNSDLRTWKWHVATQVPALEAPENATIQFADLDGDKVDEPILILLNGGLSNKVEFHTWNPGWWSWRFNTASNQDSVNPANNLVLFADVDGNNIDEALLVGLRATGSGKVEFHTWNQGVGSWRFNTASNQSSL
jgi:hypothetical protein